MDQQILQLYYPLNKGLWDLYLVWFSPRGEDDGGYFSFGIYCGIWKLLLTFQFQEA